MESKRLLCECGNLLKPNGSSKVTGLKLYYKVCSQCLKARNKQGTCGDTRSLKRASSRLVYTNFKLQYCESCGFIPVHRCQLDVDHKDGDYMNNNKDNLQTLCANCHRLKTFRRKDWNKISS